MEETRALARRRAGQVTLSTEMFDAEQREGFDKLLAIADRSPQLVWDDKGGAHNLDFILVRGNIEPVKDFCLKAAFTMKVSIQADPHVQIVQADGDVLVTSAVTLSRGERRITMNGASSTKEVLAKGGNPARAFHDAVARAQTRAMKIGMEAMMGFAFVNLLIQTLFGAFQAERPEDAGVQPERAGGKRPSPDEASKEAKKIGADIYRRMKAAVESGEKPQEWMDRQWLRVQYNLDTVSVLRNVRDEIDVQLAGGKG